MKISLIDMGRTKKRNVRESIISILSRDFPLSIMKIYHKIKKEYSLDVTYQAAFKVIKEMIQDGVLEKNNREYQLNVRWIKELESELSLIKKVYLKETEDLKETDMRSRISSFLARFGSRVREYIGKDEACIIAVSGGGRFFAVDLYHFLVREGVKVEYREFNWLDGSTNKDFHLTKENMQNKKIILVDSDIYSGKTYQIVMAQFNKFRKKFNIKDIKYLADKDILGLADFN